MQFVVSVVAATLVIGSMTVAVSRHIGTQQAIQNAKQVTRIAGEAIVAHHLDDRAYREDPAAVRRLDAVVRKSVLRAGIFRVKIWTGDGRIVYSDEPRLIGRRFRLDARQRALLGGRTGVQARVSSLHESENRFEHGEQRLLEVYVPIRDRFGRPVVFEAYQRFSAVSASAQRLWMAFAPALLGGLALMFAVMLPLARTLARRLRDAQLEREALLRRALDASQDERRSIAADLHDGVVQSLVGTSYALTAEADRLGGVEDTRARDALRRGAETARDSVRALRSLLVDIYPPTLHRAGLATALGDLARTHTHRGIATSVDMPDDFRVDEETERMLFRSAQEALRNTLKHSGASTARIALWRESDRIVMEIHDDGAGFDPAELERRLHEGHFGLRLLRDLLADAGGHIVVDAAPGLGAIVRVALPA